MTLVDTNIIVSLHVPTRAVAATARMAGHHPRDLFIAPQTIFELYAVLTRPAVNNGYGLPPSEAVRAINALSTLAQIVEEPVGMRKRWLDLVVRHGVTGKASHDARLAAYALQLGLSAILTDDAGFARYGLPLV